MAKTEDKTASRFETFTKKADAILTTVGQNLQNLTAEVQKLAVIVVDVRESIEREVKSKKTEKAVTVKDWDGRSASYREWYNDILLPMIAQRIPVEYQGTIRTRLQNQVQEEMHRRASSAQKAHLGLAKQSKATTQNQKNAAKKNTAPRDTEEGFTVDTLVEYVKASTPKDAAQGIAAQCEAFAKNVRASDLTKAAKSDCAKLLGQAIQHLMSVRSTMLDSTANTTPKRSGVKVEA